MSEDKSVEEGDVVAEGSEDKAEEKGFWAETFSTVFWALIIAFFLRTFLFQPFHIPSGSMEPNLFEGDYIISTKYSVGYGPHSAAPIPMPFIKGRWFERVPEPGEVIIFRPEGSQKNFIKRLIGLPGDRVQMINGFLHINGEAVTTDEVTPENLVGGSALDGSYIQLRETLKSGKSYAVQQDRQGPNPMTTGDNPDNTPVLIVPSGYYLFMGDNRDNSADGRFKSPRGIGFVPRENLMGKAEFVLLSVDDEFELIKPWTWGNVRGDRWFKGIK